MVSTGTSNVYSKGKLTPSYPKDSQHGARSSNVSNGLAETMKTGTTMKNTVEKRLKRIAAESTWLIFCSSSGLKNVLLNTALRIPRWHRPLA